MIYVLGQLILQLEVEQNSKLVTLSYNIYYTDVSDANTTYTYGRIDTVLRLPITHEIVLSQSIT
jgi:hypothetical protein